MNRNAKTLTVLLAVVFLFIALQACAPTQTAPPVPGQVPVADQTQAKVNNAVAWLGGFAQTVLTNGPAVVTRLCSAGVMSEGDCQTAALAETIGAIVIPAFVGNAQSAVADYQTAPTAVNSAAIDKAMVPVYTAAIAANTPAK